MDSANESFTISCTETLLETQPSSETQPKLYTRILSRKRRISFFILVLVLLISCSMIISYIRRNNKSKPSDVYLSRSNRYYCHLTTYSSLCYNSMSSVVNTTNLQTGPGPIFSGSIRVAIDQLKNTNGSITKALSSSKNGSMADSRLHDCREWVGDSTSRLNGSLKLLLRFDSRVDALTFEELDEIKSSIVGARYSALNCFIALREIGGEVGDEEKVGVEEVRTGVDKARKMMINSLGLFDLRELIFNDFYNPFFEIDESYDYSYTYHSFDYRFLVCLYSALYLFLALLYFLFWRGD